MMVMVMMMAYHYHTYTIQYISEGDKDLDTSVIDAFSAVYVWRHAYTVEMKKSNIYHVITSHRVTGILIDKSDISFRDIIFFDLGLHFFWIFFSSILLFCAVETLVLDFFLCLRYKHKKGRRQCDL